MESINSNLHKTSQFISPKLAKCKHPVYSAVQTSSLYLPSMTNHNDDKLFERSCCPIACALDQLGDKWTLLVIRDLLLGKRRYQEFLESPESIATNILADRLKKLEAAGIIVLQTYQLKPARHEYLLTQKGEDLRPVIEALVRWGKTHFPGAQVFRPHQSTKTSNTT